MKLFSSCEKCHKPSLFIKYWTFKLPLQKINMKSKTQYCMKCAYQLRKGFSIMGKNNES